MTAEPIEQRIFVVGVPRSGTTLVQSLIAAHDRVTSFPESHFFSRYFAPLPPSRAILTGNPLSRVQEFLLESSADSSRHPGESPPMMKALEDQLGGSRRLALPLKTRSVTLQLLRLLDELALERDKRVWVEKTPRHLHYISFLESCLEAQGNIARTDFVHVIRKGLPTVASLFQASRQWERSYDLRECVGRWNDDMACSLARSSSPRDHFVFYEELTKSPEAAAERLFYGLGLDWLPEILDRYAATSKALVTVEETWKADVGKRIEPSRNTVGSLTARELEVVRRGLRSSLYEQLWERVGVNS